MALDAWFGGEVVMPVAKPASSAATKGAAKNNARMEEPSKRSQKAKPPVAQAVVPVAEPTFTGAKVEAVYGVAAGNARAVFSIPAAQSTLTEFPGEEALIHFGRVAAPVLKQWSVKSTRAAYAC